MESDKRPMNIGPYRVLARLGEGGMGEVYRARDTRLGRDVAIKTLPEEFARDAERVARFEREARLLAAVNHPNIAGIYGLEESNGARFLVRGGKYENPEGTSRERNAVIEFPSYEAAVACWHSPEYQAALRLREPVSTADLVIVEGYDGPQPG